MSGFRRLVRTALVTMSLAGLLAGCNTARGAGFQSEVLRASETQVVDGERVYDFDVYPVTRATLPVIESWPTQGPRRYAWINAVDQPSSLLIQPGDVLEVTIWDAEENSLLTAPGQRVAELRSVTVESDGRIFIPFVGQLRVSGMSPATARSRIEEALVVTVPSAQVQLSVEAGQANTVNLVSGLGRPGVYELPGRNTSLLAMIAEAGGVRPGLENPQVRLFRGRQTYGISLERLFDSPNLDSVLVGGDRVIVEEEERSFLSLGATNQQAIHPFPEDHVSALEALAIVGGVEEDRANPQGVLILREYAASALGDGVTGPTQTRVVFTIDLTSADGLFSAGKFEIEDGDLVYATESPLNTARTIFGVIASGIALVNAVN